MTYLYVCHFSNGHIKVGRSTCPAARIAQHEARVGCVGIELVEHHIVECIGFPAAAEAALIQRCADAGGVRRSSEWFDGLDYFQVCEWASDAAQREDHGIQSLGISMVQRLGGPTVIARIVGLAVPTVHGWKRIPEWHCPAIERAKRAEGVEVSVEDMRPDIAWARVKDKTWPHPKGRPAIDPSATQARTPDAPAIPEKAGV